MVSPAPAPEVPPSRDGPRRLLVFEPEVFGHPPEFLRHLLEHQRRSGAFGEVELVVHPELERRFWRDGGWDAAFGGSGVRLWSLTSEETEACLEGGEVARGRHRWRIVRSHAARLEVDHVLAMRLDPLQLCLALERGSADRPPVSGILFRPSVHYASSGMGAPTLPERVRDLRKRVLYGRMLANPGVHRVLSLDPFFSEYAEGAFRGGEKVVALPDPAPDPDPDGDGRVGVDLPEGRVLFLLFGAIAARKGIFPLLSALERLPEDVASRTAVLFAGKVADSDSDGLHRRVDEVRRSRPEVWVGVEDRRIPDPELAALLRRCDVVLAPYQRFVGSSGVLVRAARHGKPVLSQEYGLLGAWVRRHDLGCVADAGDPASLGEAMSRMVREGPGSFVDPAGAEAFLEGRRPDDFAAVVASAVAAGGGP